ncbi:MAG: cell wall hydrolase [Bdellovibrionales bacterium]|nr:cell wall hydrolase [Bdellovibrionales bacterium]
MIRVSRVVLTRAKSGLYPRNACSVIFQKAQFSWTANRRAACVSDKSWTQAKKAAEVALQSGPSGKLYFHAAYVRPRWARFCVGRERHAGDDHIYYSKCFRDEQQMARYKRTTRSSSRVADVSDSRTSR